MCVLGGDRITCSAGTNAVQPTSIATHVSSVSGMTCAYPLPLQRAPPLSIRGEPRCTSSSMISNFLLFGNNLKDPIFHTKLSPKSEYFQMFHRFPLGFYTVGNSAAGEVSTDLEQLSKIQRTRTFGRPRRISYAGFPSKSHKQTSSRRATNATDSTRYPAAPLHLKACRTSGTTQRRHYDSVFIQAGVRLSAFLSFPLFPALSLSRPTPPPTHTASTPSSTCGSHDDCCTRCGNQATAWVRGHR